MVAFRIVRHDACQFRAHYVDGKPVSREAYDDARDRCDTLDSFTTTTGPRSRDGCSTTVQTMEGRER